LGHGPNQGCRAFLNDRCVYYLNSRNILNEGLKIYRQELAITKVERKSDFGNKAHSMKPEAHPIASGVGG
jgi:hypothetical protein